MRSLREQAARLLSGFSRAIAENEIRRLMPEQAQLLEEGAPFFRCTYEWDEKSGHDERNDPIFRRHICSLPMHHDGPHVSNMVGCEPTEHEGIVTGVKESPNAVSK